MAQQIGWSPGVAGIGGGSVAPQPSMPQAPVQGIDPPVQYMIHLVQDSSGKTVPLQLGGAGGQAALPISLVNRAGNPVTLAPQAAPAPVGAIVGRNEDQALTTSTDTALSFDRVDRDVGGMYCGCDPTELSVPQPGRYAVSFNVDVDDSGGADATAVSVKVKKNGVAILNQPAVKQGTNWHASKASFPMLATGDVLTLEVNSDGSDSAATGDGSSTPLLEVMFYSQ